MRTSHLALLAAFVLAPLAGCQPPAQEESLAFSAEDGKADDLLKRNGRLAVTNALPIVLHHGFNASPDSEWGWNDKVKETLERLGHKVFISQVNPYAAPSVRAPELEAFIEGVLISTGAEQVHLIAHSQGGLDARYLTSPRGLDRADLVKTITTISTPHHGTFIADTAGGFGGNAEAVTAAATAGKSAPDVMAGIMAKQLNQKAREYQHDLPGALRSMAEKRIDAEFNDLIEDAPGLYIQSYAGVSNVAGWVNPQDIEVCTPLTPEDEGARGTLARLEDRVRDTMTVALKPVAAFVAHGFRLRPNDGVVRVDSAVWGRYRGCLLADHMGVVGQGTDAGRADRKTHFDIFVFYAELAKELVETRQ